MDFQKVRQIKRKGAIIVKKEFLTSNAKFVYSKNELGYQEVLDRFKDAKQITIITFNISEKQNTLVNALKKAGDSCIINVITNIPNRWETYYGDAFRDKARKKINLYMTKLMPESLGAKTAVFFDFSNHGKIIMTDSIVYVGSANYSEESANNTEFGFLSEDKELIEFINMDVLPDIQSLAIPYYEYDYTAVLLEANVALAAVYNIKNELFEEVYRLHDDIDGEWYYYEYNETSLTVFTLDKTLQIIDEACNVARDVYDAIDVITNGDEDETTNANDEYDEILAVASHIEEIRSYDTLIELSEFDSGEFVNQQLQKEYAMEAYEENLENCINSASEDAQNIVLDLTQTAKDDIDKLLSELQEYCDKYANFIDNLRAREIKKISPKIDNT